MTTRVSVTNLAKTFRNRGGEPIRAVDGISFSVEEGELFSLLGPNGASKTTTISMVSGLIQPSGGTIEINGHSLRDDPIAARRQIGVVPQEVALYPRLSARVNLEFFGRMYGLSGRMLHRRVDELLEFVELSDRAGDRVENFSGGMKRRVNIAAGLIHAPRILYMDEPTVGVDPQSRRRILDLIAHLKDEQGIAIIYTTHLMEEAEELSDRVGIIDHGRLIAVGTQEELTAQVAEQDRVEIDLEQGDEAGLFLERLRTLAGVSAAEFERVPVAAGHPAGTNRVVALAANGRTVLAPIVDLAGKVGAGIVSIRLEEPNLESVFLALTGRALRE
jgi:ABC-2 type transport system ATP-binding protein